MPLEDTVLRELHRAAELAGRAGIAVVADDAPRIDALSGSRARTLDAIRRLRAAGKIEQVRRGLLVLREPTGISRVTLLELVAVAVPKPYLITGGAALTVHGLTDQHFFKFPVLTTGEVKNNLVWRGETGEFHKTAEERIWGGEKMPPRVRNAVEPIVATPARALLDSINHPRYGVSLAQAVDALRTIIERSPQTTDELLRVAARYGQSAASRRVGFLIERLAGVQAAEPFRTLVGTSRTPVLLRARGPAVGPVDRRWRVQVNVDPALLGTGAAA